LTEKEGYRVLFVEAIGGHRGMDGYDLALCGALAEQGVDITLFTCDETAVPQGLAFPVDLAFRGVFGQAPAWLRGLRYGRALARIARQPRDLPSIVHVHFFHALPLDLTFLACMKGARSHLVVSAHDARPFDARRWQMPLVRGIYRLADVLIPHSQASQAALAEMGFGSKLSPVIPLGHHLPHEDDLLSTANARLQLEWDPLAPVILFFGQIKAVKGLDILLRAMSLLQVEHPAARLVIAGKVWKDDWSRYARLIDELGLEKTVDLYLHYVPEEAVPVFFAAAGVVVLPYLHVYQSAVLMMALSHARPVVATRVGGLAEVIRDGETGFLVPPHDPQALAEAIDCILQDPRAAQAMGERARAWVQEHCAWSQIAARTRQVYELILTS
jgi:D-inositol-3-phosphate glycosyltransferase